MNKINVLVLSDSEDFTSDLVCIDLYKRGIKYLRFNRDQINDLNIHWHVSGTLSIQGTFGDYQIDEKHLKSIYYRAPIYLRETFSKTGDLETQIKRSQTMAFFRNLEYFDKALWVNRPSKTFVAESKIIQLKKAKEIGFNIPETTITNMNKTSLPYNMLIAKSIDTALFDFDSHEAFSYANIITKNDLSRYNNANAPFFIQQYIENKLDLRITTIGDKLFACKITTNDNGVEGDWRLRKNDVSFVPYDLPQDINKKCLDIVKSFGLSYAGIDLIFSRNKYFFVELNPTGEWAWLQDSCGFDIAGEICNVLS